LRAPLPALLAGSRYACDDPQGLGSEQEYIKGQAKWMRYPGMPKAALADVADACKLIASEGLHQIWACKGNRPANGINCEEQWIDGELLWACRI